MSWLRESAFTNVTLWPTAMVTCDGATAPLVEIVMVAPLGPSPVPDGVVGPEAPPQRSHRTH